MKMQRKILKAWKRPVQPTPKKVVIVFRVLPSGEAKDVKLQRSSGSDECDKEAVDSVAKASPFDPLPSALPALEFQFTFDSDSIQK